MALVSVRGIVSVVLFVGYFTSYIILHHAQRISLAVVKGEGESVKAAADRLKAEQVVRDSLNPPGA